MQFSLGASCQALSQAIVTTMICNKGSFTGVGLIAVALLALPACSSGGSAGGPGTVRPCEMVDTALECGPGDTDCYAAGVNSTCPSGGLCVGDDGEMTCAFVCHRDEDCTVDEDATVCMADCATSIVNGYCVTPSMRDVLLGTTCTTGSSSTDGVAGR